MPRLHRGLSPIPCGGGGHGTGLPGPHGVPHRPGHRADAGIKRAAYLFRANVRKLSVHIHLPAEHKNRTQIHDLLFPELREQGHPGSKRQGLKGHAALERRLPHLRRAPAQPEADREFPLLSPVRIRDILCQPPACANPHHRPRRELVLCQGLPQLGIRPPGQMDGHRPPIVVRPGRDRRFQGGQGYPHLRNGRVAQTGLFRPVRPAGLLEQADGLEELPLPDSRPCSHPAAGWRGLRIIDKNDTGRRTDSGQIPPVLLGHLHVRRLHRQHHDRVERHPLHQPGRLRLPPVPGLPGTGRHRRGGRGRSSAQRPGDRLGACILPL